MRQIGLGTFEANQETFNLVNQVLRSGRLSYGRMSQEFEQRFAALHGCKFGVLSNSGTSSLLVALQTLKELHGWSDGSEVIVPALTFVATINIVLQCRLRPVLVDVEPEFYGIEPELVMRAIDNKTKCIIPVHTFGQPCDMSTLRRWYYADNGDHPMSWIEDSCEAMLVKHSGTKQNEWNNEYGPIGSWGDIACFSTYIAHLLVTGVGGISTTNNPDYAQYMRSLCNHGIDLSELPTGEDYDASWLARKFSFTTIGHSFRISELESALGLAQLDDLASIIEHRQKIANYFNEQLKLLEDKELLQLPHTRPNTENARMMYPVIILQEPKQKFMKYLNEHGIGTRDMLPLTNQPCYKGLWNEDDYPVAKWINEHGLYWGCHQSLTQEDLSYVVQVAFDYFGNQ